METGRRLTGESRTTGDTDSCKPKDNRTLWPRFNTSKTHVEKKPKKHLNLPTTTSPWPRSKKRGVSEMTVMVDLLMKKGEARTFGVIKGDRERVTVGLRQKSCSIAGRNIKQ